MGKKGYATIPRTLLDCITFLAGALTIRSVPAFFELLAVTAQTNGIDFVCKAVENVKMLGSQRVEPFSLSSSASTKARRLYPCDLF